MWKLHCCACDVLLSDLEATRKSPITNEYLDMCDHCLGSIAGQIPESIEDEDPLLMQGDLFLDDGMPVLYVPEKEE